MCWVSLYVSTSDASGSTGVWVQIGGSAFYRSTQPTGCLMIDGPSEIVQSLVYIGMICLPEYKHSTPESTV